MTDKLSTTPSQSLSQNVRNVEVDTRVLNPVDCDVIHLLRSSKLKLDIR